MSCWEKGANLKGNLSRDQKLGRTAYLDLGYFIRYIKCLWKEQGALGTSHSMAAFSFQGEVEMELWWEGLWLYQVGDGRSSPWNQRQRRNLETVSLLCLEFTINYFSDGFPSLLCLIVIRGNRAWSQEPGLWIPCQIEVSPFASSGPWAGSLTLRTSVSSSVKYKPHSEYLWVLMWSSNKEGKS